MDLFEASRQEQLRTEAPLAMRMRPRNLDEFLGQEHIIGPGKVLRRAIESDRLSSLIFHGPPGCGKTALAAVIARRTKAHFEQLNAVTSGVADLRRVIKEARERQGMYGRKTILFIDEIHRFNKAQQDALLPYVEDGTVILIGATTENPYFEVNPPLVSRSRVFAFKALTEEQVKKALRRALEDRERGLGKYRVQVDQEAMDHLVRVANGDARSALNALELAVTTTEPGEDGVRRITLEVAVDSIQKRAIRYDKDGDAHYDTISAFIKSMRGSDPDATLYWLARMLYAGEDPRFIARRMVIHAAEDVGLADPQALVVAVAAAQAVEYVGLPEARIPMAQAAIYIATAPKSNSVYRGIEAAMKDVGEKRTGDVPLHLRDSHYKGAAKLGHGKGYRYPHDYPGNWVDQPYLPKNLQGKVRYYQPSCNGYERELRQRLDRISKTRVETGPKEKPTGKG